MSSFAKKAAKVDAQVRAQGDLERTRRIVAILGALGLGLGMGVALAENRNPWAVAGVLVFGVSMMVETVVMHRQLQRSVEKLDQLMTRDTEA